MSLLWDARCSKSQNESAQDRWNDLVIPESHRSLLTSLIENHLLSRKTEGLAYSKAPKGICAQIDIVRGKGRGMIILLHGPPGSGKTSTAETLAAFTRRPLYSLTCGDLGTGADQLERELERHTSRAHQWDCVLPLDEADVFLSRRNWKDTRRNALVSVFLRQLVYYSGILILTTNRVGVVDEAFKSRIHVSLSYPPIGLAETRQIWDNILNRIKRDNKTGHDIPIRFDRSRLLAYAEKHYRRNEPTESAWNGRQIRNAFQLAIALGQHEREETLKEMRPSGDADGPGKKLLPIKLTTANFKSIAATARAFEDYLAEVRGKDSKIAREESIRDDTFKAPNRVDARNIEGKGGSRGNGSQRDGLYDFPTSSRNRGGFNTGKDVATSRGTRRTPAKGPVREEEDSDGTDDDEIEDGEDGFDEDDSDDD